MRPIFSVVIPTYEPDRFLIEALQSVLAQDPGSDRMQIAIVDDASPQTRPSTLLSTLALSERVEIHEHETNLGLAGNWNRAIAHARGDFVHLLHQDDLVQPGFYERLRRGFESNSRVGMAFSRHAYIDEHQRVTRISHRERWFPGVLSSWMQRIGEKQRLQCPAVLMRRDVYETLGGFRDDLRYALDWEMWVRVAAHYAVWYEPAVLAYYRRHGNNETARLQSVGATGPDTIRAIDVFSQHFPLEQRQRLRERAYRRLVRSHLKRSSKLLKLNAKEGAKARIDVARDAIACLPEDQTTRRYRRKLSRLEQQLGSTDQQ
jgi:glycosyltransferase involved in cell wall biosynthesis